MNAFQNIIIRNPEITAGKLVIKGTRITVEIILKKLSEGISIENLLEIYPTLNQ